MLKQNQDNLYQEIIKTPDKPSTSGMIRDTSPKLPQQSHHNNRGDLAVLIQEPQEVVTDSKPGPGTHQLSAKIRFQDNDEGKQKSRRKTRFVMDKSRQEPHFTENQVNHQNIFLNRVVIYIHH